MKPRGQTKTQSIPNYEFFAHKFQSKELHWYCPLCGNIVKYFDNIDKLKDFLLKGAAKCKKGHGNRISIVNNKLHYEIEPILVKDAMFHKRKNITIGRDKPLTEEMKLKALEKKLNVLLKEKEENKKT